MSIRSATTQDYPEIMEIWSSSVRATHDFLKQGDFERFQLLIPEAFLPVLRVFMLEDEGKAQAFFSVSDDNLEMLFVKADARGKGYGKVALDYIIRTLKVYKVDVNEQNEQAVGFYMRCGYYRTGRSEKDGMGKPYPLLHLKHIMESPGEQVSVTGLKIIGISVRTSNANGRSATDMASLWQRFGEEQIASKIPGKVNGDIYAIYTDYDSNYTGNYTAIIGMAVNDLDELSEGMTGREFPKEVFSIYNVEGPMLEAIATAWTSIWQYDAALHRKYTYDFERYIVTASGETVTGMQIGLSVGQR